MTTFQSALTLCGLSGSEAAELLGVDSSTVQSWIIGSSAPPQLVWVMLADLFCRIEDLSCEVVVWPHDEQDVRTLNNLLIEDEDDEPLSRAGGKNAVALAVLRAFSSVE